MAYTSNTMRLRTPAPFSWSCVPAMAARSSILTPPSSAPEALAAQNSAGKIRRRISVAMSEAILDAARRKSGARAARGMALHVHRDRIHRDVRRRGFDMHGERGRVAAEPLRADAERVDRIGQLGLELRALRVVAARAEGPGRRDL